LEGIWGVFRAKLGYNWGRIKDFFGANDAFGFSWRVELRKNWDHFGAKTGYI
jgi:hypothetical protein